MAWPAPRPRPAPHAPVLPIVLYNGERRWRAPTALPAFLKPLQPQMRYVLIDEGAYPDETLRGLPQNLAAAIFQAERLQTPAAIQDFVARLEVETRAPAFAACAASSPSGCARSSGIIAPTPSICPNWTICRS
ncbi:Rpn family recombination-promoting nuclease/putative transposase [Thauera aromatica]|nr:Rpn family recombination-promoting nuclease/putative transposase [Thauera aromatica]MCK2128233.1 Rpn family recombination-promoting nuclease/putative transposase [Thauera aromatica]